MTASSDFREYMHVEKYGNDEVQGIELGELFIFPKLDGTNSSLWYDSATQALRGGSRHRELSLDSDNAGFFTTLSQSEAHKSFLSQHPSLILYGEWLVPHTLKTYREDCWRKFWVFDVYSRDTDSYLSYPVYRGLLDGTGIDYIPPLAIVKNGTYDNFVHVMEGNNLFIQDGKGLGEGITLKNYDYYNRDGNQIWAKLIRSEFKEQHYRTMGAPEHDIKLVEEQIAEVYINESLCTKVLAKIKVEKEGWTSKYIPELLGRIWYDLITEESWNFLKEFENPTINYKTLKHFVIRQIKVLLKDEVF